MDRRIKQFGGKLRAFLPDEYLNNIADANRERMNDDELEALEIIQEGFSQLTQIQRTIMSMISTQDMTLDKIAKALGMPSGTVRSHFNRAKNKLKKYVTQNADRSIYIESMLRGSQDDKEETGECAVDDADEGSGHQG